jgi:hypothetical protein
VKWQHVVCLCVRCVLRRTQRTYEYRQTTCCHTNSGIAPRIFNLIGWKLVVIFTLRSLYPRESAPRYNPSTVLDRPSGSKDVEAPGLTDVGHVVVRLSALRTGRVYPQKIFLVLVSVRVRLPQDHSAPGRIMSMKNSSDTIWNRTRELPACSGTRERRSWVNSRTSLDLLENRNVSFFSRESKRDFSDIQSKGLSQTYAVPSWGQRELR